MSGKTGSSTQRYVMNEMWNGKVKGCNILDRETDRSNTTWAVATREPVDHFLSGYKEMLFRIKLWEDPSYAQQRAPKESQSFLKVLDGWDVDKRLALRESGTPEDLKIKNKMLEAFVREWDGEDIFDEHLGLQAIKLRPNNWGMYTFNDTLESEILSEEMARLAKVIGAPVPPPVKKRSHEGEPVDLSLASEQTIQKICLLRAQDFCCMNYELPEVCKKVDGIGERVQCEWVEQFNKLAIKPIFVGANQSSGRALTDDESKAAATPSQDKNTSEDESKADNDEKASLEEKSAEVDSKTSLAVEVAPKEGELFEPGTLSSPRHEVISKCKYNHICT
jgi:hypothetical protein